MQKLNTRFIALSGVLLAFSIGVLFVASNLPGLELTALCLAAFPIYILYRQAGGLSGFLFYIVATALSLLIVPNKMGIIIFIIIIGPYIAIKSIVEGMLLPKVGLVPKPRLVCVIIIKVVIISGLANLCAAIFDVAFMSGTVWKNMISFLPIPLVLAIFFSIYLLLADFLMTIVYSMLKRTKVFRSFK